VNLATGQCPDGPHKRDAVVGGASSASGPERALTLLLFDAEEYLARGAPDKAIVHASRAVKEHPESLTARALLERARRELLRGRRKERLEARVKEAQALIDRGELPSAHRIVTSVLKLIPDHAIALGLFARLKSQRSGTAEAEAQSELETLARSQARRLLETAREALAKGWDRNALLALHRGLRLVPGDAELLALLGKVQASTERLDRERARKRALQTQVRAALDLLGKGALDESETMLRAVLQEEPQDGAAQAAMEQLRRRRQPVVTRPPLPRASRTSTPEPRFVPRGGTPPVQTGQDRPKAIPQEILLPRTVRRATPLGLIFACAALVGAVIWFWPGRPSPRSATTVNVPQPPVEAPAEGPLSQVAEPLRRAIESSIAAYGRALERGDLELLAQARPDLSAEAREQRIAPFRGGVNSSAELKILSVVVGADQADVRLLRSEIIVGVNEPGSRVEETLHFQLRDGQWALR